MTVHHTLVTDSDGGIGRLVSSVISEKALSGDFPYSQMIVKNHGPGYNFPLDKFVHIHTSLETTYDHHILTNKEHSVYVYVRDFKSNIFGYIIAKTRTLLDATYALIVSSLPPVPEPNEDQIKMNFWRTGGGGAIQTHRDIDAPSWEAIKHNYTQDSRDRLSKLFHGTTADTVHGRIAMLYGPPGTGKTTLIRALARQWSSWCTAAYVIDPEQFLNDAGYLSEVMLHNEDTYGLENETQKWQLIILEDAGELIINDARTASGQALSRLLNTADGILGQGCKVMFMITTNHDVESLHESVTRPGRCLVAAEIGKFSVDEATDWLGADYPAPKKPLTLAEMYAVKYETSPIQVLAPQAPVTTGQYLLWS